jgi:hypothetical protein
MMMKRINWHAYLWVTVQASTFHIVSQHHLVSKTSSTAQHDFLQHDFRAASLSAVKP